MLNFCTLFDSNYLDKALAMYNSLIRVKADFKLYVLCFDELAYSVLENMQLDMMILEHLEEFETPELLELKKNRTKAEYCWTCTAASIQYFITKYQLFDLTYIDADLYFYSNPEVLYAEIVNSNAEIAIMEHRFNNSQSGRNGAKTSGKYCVEFNYFNTSNNAREALAWWKKSCFDWCYQKYEPAHENTPGRYGDQKYLEQFPILFQHVHEIQNLGAGVAPWNLSQYRLEMQEGFNITLRFAPSNKLIPLVFYHFQNLKYITHTLININALCRDKKLKFAIYHPYLIELFMIRKMLQNEYSLSLDIKKSYSGNKVKAFIQRYIMPYRIRDLSDLVNVEKILAEKYGIDSDCCLK